MKRVLVILTVSVFLAFMVWIGLGPKPKTSPPFVVGPSRPPGRVQPQVVGAWDRGYLLAPDGSLWAWGGTTFGSADEQLGKRTATPCRLGTNTDWQKISASWTF